MKKFILIGTLIVLAAAAGFATILLRKSQSLPPPHTIVYRQTSFDESGNVTFTSVVLRRVLADGSWHSTQLLTDGTIRSTHGQFAGVLTKQAASADMPEHLHYKYIAGNNKETETWVSPELQDFLKFSALREDGSKETTLEAINISQP